MKITIDKHLTAIPMELAPHGDSLTLDVDPGKVTIDGEHNLAELLARLEELEGKVEELDEARASLADRIGRALSFLERNQCSEAKHILKSR